MSELPVASTDPLGDVEADTDTEVEAIVGPDSPPVALDSNDKDIVNIDMETKDEAPILHDESNLKSLDEVDILAKEVDDLMSEVDDLGVDSNQSATKNSIVDQTVSSSLLDVAMDQDEESDTTSYENVDVSKDKVEESKLEAMVETMTVEASKLQAMVQSMSENLNKEQKGESTDFSNKEIQTATEIIKDDEVSASNTDADSQEIVSTNKSLSKIIVQNAPVGKEGTLSEKEVSSEELIAEQMAAVAKAANTASISPSAAAQYARNISATIVQLPPSPTAKNINSRSQNFNSLVSIDEDLFLDFLQKKFEKKEEETTEEDIDDDDMQRKSSYGNIDAILNENNLYFLHYILLANNYRFMTTEGKDEQNVNSPSQKREGYSSEQEHHASDAASLVLKTISNIDNSFNHLIDLIPQVSSSVEHDGLQDFDPNSSFTSHSCDDSKAILDLLPPCNPPQGDATNSFFRACEPIPVKKPKKEEDLESSNEDQNSAIEASSGKDVNSLKVDVDTKNIAVQNMQRPSSRGSLASTFMGNMFSRVTRGRGKKKSDDQSVTTLSSIQSNSTSATFHSDNEEIIERHVKIGEDYNVTISREMLGLTVENVLERTVVRTVLPNGAAKRAGTKVGSLVVKVGTVETRNLTHFETIDELRQSVRPLKLVLRRIGKDALKGAREEMGRLIKGGGFGTVHQSKNSQSAHQSEKQTSSESQNHEQEQYNDQYYNILSKQWMEGTKRRYQTTSTVISKKDEALSRAGAKLAWLLSLLIIGLDREARKGKSFVDEDISYSSDGSLHSLKDYADAAKSVSKILLEYMQKHFENVKKNKETSKTVPMNDANARRKKQSAPPPHIQDKQRQAVPGASKRSQNKGTNLHENSHAENAILLIGDVLHRARSFLSDHNSSPAALLRGEIISLLCDILDLDNDMTLSEEEASSSTAGGETGSMNDLGSAGSLLKIIVLNCAMMQSPGCRDFDEHNKHAGNRFLAVVHRLAASRSTSARIAACSLGPVLWSHLDFPHQLQLRGVITRALHDVEVAVRRSTVTVLHEIAELVFDPRAVPWLVLMCERAMTDPEPQLRGAAMTLTYHLAEHLPNAYFGDASEGSRSIRSMPSREDPKFIDVYLLQCKLLPVATKLAEDESPSVRLSVAAQCDRLAAALGDHWHSVLIDLLQQLLGDKDEKVRGEATLCIPRLIENVIANDSDIGDKNIPILDSLLPVALKLQKDPVPYVRICLATAAGELLAFLVWLHSADVPTQIEGETKNEPKQMKYIDDILIPLLQTLLQDRDPEVTSASLRAVTNASRGHARDVANRRLEDDSLSLSSQSHALDRVDPVFRPVLSEAQVLRLVPTLTELSSSKQWRIRQSAVEIVPALLGCTHNMETRTQIADLCVRLMSDQVDAVRKSAAECLCLGGSNLGSDQSEEADNWLSTVVIPHLESCRDSTESKQRLLSLKMAEMLIMEIGKWNDNTLKLEEINTESGEVEEKSQTLTRKTLEVASKLANDKIVNVRLNVGRMFGNILHCLSSDDDLEFIITTLETQIEFERVNGGDRDVIYFARKSISQAKERISRLDEVSSLR
ncbi:hypothetical protein CTEN210_13794 [Chaetoceros tenuissimus]|uniref:PDZ domain-containing protein n=1 Tax=Chaetoceros tenuissimus TaxID=426638 RepID=A0AAD3HBS0_9STRA|nr:hypothetical protein CTEN210_13794 [Chaetoceros tenuissimus]